MVWRLWVAETLTGKPVQEVTKLATGSGSWNRILNGVGSGSHTFNLSGSPFTKTQHRHIFKPWTHSLWVCWDDTPVYAGLFTRAGWKAQTKQLTVTHSEVRILLGRRLMFSVGGWATGTVDLYSQDARHAAAYFVWKAFRDGLPRWQLPVEIFAHVGGSRHDIAYNTHFKTGEELVDAISKENGGPDIDFRPERVPLSDWFRWRLRVGNPLLNGGQFEWDLAAQSGAQDVETFTEGINMTTGVFTPGEGSDKVRPFGQAALETGLEPYQGPYLDLVEVFSQEPDIARLDAHALAIRREGEAPTERVTFSVRADHYPGAGALVPGMTVRAKLKADEWLDGGWTPFRYVLGLSGGMGKTITLKLKGDE